SKPVRRRWSQIRGGVPASRDHTPGPRPIATVKHPELGTYRRKLEPVADAELEAVLDLPVPVQKLELEPPVARDADQAVRERQLDLGREVREVVGGTEGQDVRCVREAGDQVDLLPPEELEARLGAERDAEHVRVLVAQHRAVAYRAGLDRQAPVTQPVGFEEVLGADDEIAILVEE